MREKEQEMKDFFALDESRTADQKLKDISYALDQSAIVAITDRTGKIIHTNKKFTEISQYDSSELIGHSHSIINSGHHSRAFFKEMWATIGRGNVWQGEVKNRKKDGSFYWVDTTIVPFLNEKNKPYQYISIRNDITERKEAEQMIRNLAYNDQLTKLPNRISFRRKLYQEVKESRRSGRKLALVFLNIDRLRYFNDSFGHETGDYILSVVAGRLKEVLPDNYTISRLAGDEFAYTVKDIRDAEHAEEITKSVQEILLKPIELAGQAYTLSMSFGIAVYPEHAKEAAELTTKAEKALYEIKQRGGGGCEIYQHGTAKKTFERILLENELRKSINLGHFNLDYQPKFDLTSREMTGVEALVRWNHPDLGRIPPDQFIQVAEETKMIIPLGEWVFKEACRQVNKWVKSEYNYQIAVNVSAVQLENPGFLATIKSILNETGTAPELIQIELTESAFGNRTDMQETIEKLRAMGITVAIDDFGTGYSSFSYIKELPADTLKIDMAFTKDIHQNVESHAIVKAILSIAETVGFNVVAEGIELEEQIRVLQELGCQEGQGYFYSKPTSPKECEKFMKKIGIDE